MRFRFKECETLTNTHYTGHGNKLLLSVSQLQKSKANLSLSNGNKSIFSVIFCSILSLTSFFRVYLWFFFLFSFQFYLFTFIESLCVYMQKYCNHPSVIKDYATAMLRALYKASSNVRKLQLWDKLKLCMTGRSVLLHCLMKGTMTQ